MTTEDEKVEIQLARTPPLPIAPTERPLKAFEGDEERQRAGSGIGAKRDVDRGDRVAELRLIRDADRLRGVEE